MNTIWKTIILSRRHHRRRRRRAAAVATAAVKEENTGRMQFPTFCPPLLAPPPTRDCSTFSRWTCWLWMLKIQPHQVWVRIIPPNIKKG